MIYIGQFYLAPNAQRRQELTYCATQIIQNPAFVKIFWIKESHEKEEYEEWDVFKNPKIELIPKGKRITFSDILQTANEKCPGEMIAFGNMDVFVDESIQVARMGMPLGTAACISRNDAILNDSLDDIIVTKRYPLVNDAVPSMSQDLWLVRGPFPQTLVQNTKFHFGLPGCDNRFCYELAAAGFYIWNAAPDIFVAHVHKATERDYHAQKDAIARPYLSTSPHSLSVHVTLRAYFFHYNPFQLAAVTENYLSVPQVVRAPVRLWALEKLGKPFTFINKNEWKEHVQYKCRSTWGREATLKELSTVRLDTNIEKWLQKDADYGNYLAIQQFITKVGRLPTEQELLLDDFWTVPELDLEQKLYTVRQCFLKLLGREPDAAALAHYKMVATKTGAPLSKDVVAAGLRTSPEYKQVTHQPFWNQYAALRFDL